MQEHEYKARDKTVQKMSRDGLREENLRNKEEKRITGRDTDTEIFRSEKKEELDFSKRRHERLKEEREMEQPEQSSRKPRYSREHADILDDEQDIATDADVEEGLTDDSSENPKSAFRIESIRGQPRGERAYLETVADSRDLRKKKMVRDYAAKERRKEKETSREEKAAKRESARYRETSEVMEDSLDKFHEEIKGKSKRERVLKEQRKKVSRLSFGDEGDGMVHGAGIGIRNPASAVKDAAVTAAHWKTHEEEDENAAVEGAHRAELVGESLARKSIYMRERLKGRREESRRLKESVLDAFKNQCVKAKPEEETEKETSIPYGYEEGMTLSPVKAEKTVHFTSPPKPFNEDTLLAAMETAGNKDFDSETEKKGLGTPATRAGIIEKLVSSGYAVRKGKKILPSTEGRELVNVMPAYLKSAAMTAEWENQLLMMEKGQITDTQFMGEITSLVGKILSVCREIPETERRRFQKAREVIGKCPVCGSDVYEGKQNFYCSNRQCDFALWKENRFLGSMEKTLDKKMAVELLDKACTHVKGLYSRKKDIKFDADLLLTLEDGKPRFHLEFPKKKKK